MHIRELTETELPALLDLCQRSLSFDQFSLPMLQRRFLDEPHHNPAYQLGLWQDAQLVGTLLGSVRETEGGRAASIRLLSVDPAYRRRGAASRLLRELEARLRADGFRTLRVGATAPIYFWPGLDVRYTPAFCFLQEHGFERSGEAVNMQVDLAAHDWNTSAEEERLAKQGFTVRRLEPEDEAEFSDWLAEHWGPVWRYEALATLHNHPVSTFVATRADRICAFASYNATAFENGFGPTGTEQELRGKGLGRILFHRCMRDLKELGYPTAEVCWVGPIAFYARVADAWINRVFWYLQKDL